VQWFFDKYLGNPADANSPLISLVNADLHGLPSTTIINAEIDPLRSEERNSHSVCVRQVFRLSNKPFRELRTSFWHGINTETSRTGTRLGGQATARGFWDQMSRDEI
jgi:acetyl esterase/lipase